MNNLKVLPVCFKLKRLAYLSVTLAIQIRILQDQDQKVAANSFLLVFGYPPPTRTDLLTSESFEPLVSNIRTRKVWLIVVYILYCD
jgi:hypothetical protein